MISCTKAGGRSYGFAYDNMGRLVGTTTQYSFVTGIYSNAYTYDAASNRTSLTAPDGSITTYGYDTLNRLNGLANSWAGSFGFGYDALSRRTSLTRPNGVNTSYSYDSLSRLLSVLHQAGGATIDGASYTYDNAGNRTSKTNDLNGITENYTYDALYELTQVTQGGSTTESYSYDLVGNRLSSLGVPTYNYNSSNELTSSSLGSYTYDANGNTLTDAQGRSFTWDFENRLLQATNPGVGTTTFRYDPFGRRIQKSGPLGITNYFYDAANIVEETDNTGSLLGLYLQGPGIDQPLAESRSGSLAYYSADALGSITSLTDSSGATAATYNYDAYGNMSVSSGAPANPFRYTGRESDSETGLDFYRARYYDPSVGKFLSEDPLRFGAGANFYPYANNSPTTFNDPSGQKINISRQGDTIVVSGTIGVYGPRASDNLAQQWQNGINDYWNNFGNNFHVGKCKVVFDVRVKNEGNVNWWWSLPGGLDDWVYVPNLDNYRSSTTLSFWGYWAYDLSPFGAAHEFGHMGYLPDYYEDDENGRSIPDKDRGNEIMSTMNGPVVQADIDEMVGDNIAACGCK